MKLENIMSRAGIRARMDKSGRKLYHKLGFTGKSYVVGVIDTGVNEHQELTGKLLRQAPDPNAPVASDLPVGHGTGVATKIAGTNIGIAPGVRIVPYARQDAYLPSVVAGLNFMVDWRGPKGEKVNIINLSITSHQNYAELYPTVKRCEDAGILIVCASGNKPGQDVVFPASFDQTLSVGAANNDMQPTTWHTYGQWMDVVQDAEMVVVGVHNAADEYKYADGTSFSTPIVTGIAALIGDRYFTMYGKYPSPALLRELVMFNTIDVGAAGFDMPSGVGYCTLDPHAPTIIEMTVGNTNMLVNGISKTIDQAPAIDKTTGRTLVPVRAVSEALGAKVSWDPATQLITLEGVKA